MKIFSYALHENAGHPYLTIKSDAGLLTVFLEQKHALTDRLIFCGPDTEDRLPPVVVPEDPATGRPRQTLRGFTQNKTVYDLWKRELYDPYA